MEYRDYKGRRTEEIKENNICLLGDIVEGGEDLSAILEDESYFSYEWQIIIYFKVLEHNTNILDTKIKIIELYEMNDI